MMRSILSAVKTARVVGLSCCSSSLSSVTTQSIALKNILQTVVRNYNNSNSVLGRVCTPSPFNSFSYLGLLQPKQQLADTVRTVTKFSLSGKRKTVPLVLQKFYRLNWGCWIRTKCGRHKKLYKKSANRRRRLQYHVFCNGRQSYLLDRMVTRYWRKPKFYVDDPYEPYHTREEYIHARMKPYQPFA